MTTDEIANMGIGMSFQHPPKIKGVTLQNFLNAINRSEDIDDEIRALSMENFLERELNVGFSGGELKRAEVLKLYAQSPDLLLIDEPESGVDIENIAVISKAINKILQKEMPIISEWRVSGRHPTRSFLVGSCSKDCRTHKANSFR